MKAPVLVWDLPTRVFHWLLATAFLGAYFTSGEDAWLKVHVLCGYTVLGMIAFRLLWGAVGTRYARFASFAFGRVRVVAYLRSLLVGPIEHHTGHNPAGSWAIYALLFLGLATTAMGFATLVGPDWGWLKDVHQVLGNAMLAVVCVHVAGVLASSFMHRENLARAMVTGVKQGRPGEGIRGSVWVVGALLIAFAAGFWVAAWRGDLPAVTRPADTFKSRHEHRHH